jgi:excisionase family DNA binding protein
MPFERKERITIEEIASRLSIGRLAVYALLNRGEIPAIRLGRRWIVTRHAYEQWERTCGMNGSANGSPSPAVQSSYGGL